MFSPKTRISINIALVNNLMPCTLIVSSHVFTLLMMQSVEAIIISQNLLQFLAFLLVKEKE